MCCIWFHKLPVKHCNILRRLLPDLKLRFTCIYIKPSSYYEGIEYLSTEESDLYKNWINDIAQSEIDNLSDLISPLIIREGVPNEEILNFANDVKADLIIVDRLRVSDIYPSISNIILKLIRKSQIPVLTLNNPEQRIKFNRILVPTGIIDMHSSDFNFAYEISKNFKSKISHLNVLETAEINFPVKLVEKFRDDIYANLYSKDKEFQNVETKCNRVKECINWNL